MKKFAHRIEYLLVKSLFGLFKVLPFKTASNFGALLGAWIATLPMKSNKVARRNIKKAFPDLKAKEIRAMQYKSAQHFGRTLTEMPGLYAMNRKEFEQHVTVNGLEHLVEHPGALVLTAHLGNWEAILKSCGIYGIKMANVYRRANNKKVDQLIKDMRSSSNSLQIPKGRPGAKQLLGAVKQGFTIGFLNDQKMNDGIEAPFFGQMVMTAPSLAELAIKFEKPVLPVFCHREDSGHMIIDIAPPLDIPQDVGDATIIFNQIIEEAICQNPEQWFWFHKRFKG